MAKTPSDPKAAAVQHSIEMLEAERAGLVKSMAQKQARIEVLDAQLAAIRPATPEKPAK